MTEPSEIYSDSVKEEMESINEAVLAIRAAGLSMAEAAQNLGVAFQEGPWWKRLESVGLWWGETNNG